MWRLRNSFSITTYSAASGGGRVRNQPSKLAKRISADVLVFYGKSFLQRFVEYCESGVGVMVVTVVVIVTSSILPIISTTLIHVNAARCVRLQPFQLLHVRKSPMY